jgi:hypothetical protein
MILPIGAPISLPDGGDEWDELENFPQLPPRPDGPIQSYVLPFNWSLSDKILLSNIRGWLRWRRPKAFRGKTHTGKASGPPFQWLKQLATWRLATSGRTQYEAKQLIAQRRDHRRVDGYYPVLPDDYGGSGAWSNAIRDAKKLLGFDDPFWQITLRCHHTPGHKASGK